MKKAAADHSSQSPSTAGKNGKPRSASARASKRRVNRPDFLANLERLGYSEELGARMMEKFHDSVS